MEAYIYSHTHLIEEQHNLKNFLNCLAISLIKFLGVQFDTCLGLEQSDDGLHEFHSLLLLVDVVRDFGLRVVPLGKPIQDIGYKFEIGFYEVLQRDEPWVV